MFMEVLDVRVIIISNLVCNSELTENKEVKTTPNTHISHNNKVEVENSSLVYTLKPIKK